MKLTFCKDVVIQDLGFSFRLHLLTFLSGVMPIQQLIPVGKKTIKRNIHMISLEVDV